MVFMLFSNQNKDEDEDGKFIKFEYKASDKTGRVLKRR